MITHEDDARLLHHLDGRDPCQDERERLPEVSVLVIRNQPSSILSQFVPNCVAKEIPRTDQASRCCLREVKSSLHERSRSGFMAPFGFPREHRWRDRSKGAANCNLYFLGTSTICQSINRPLGWDLPSMLVLLPERRTILRPLSVAVEARETRALASGLATGCQTTTPSPSTISIGWRRKCSPTS